MEGLYIFKGSRTLWVTTTKHMMVGHAWQWDRARKRWVMHGHFGGIMSYLKFSTTTLETLNDTDRERVLSWLMTS